VVYRWYTAEPRTLQLADDVLARVSLANAYLALLWLCLTLCIGAWNILRKGRSPLHLDIRRDVAIWGGTAGVIHGIVGAMVHYRGKGWFYYFLYPPSKPHGFPIRYHLFGFSNHTGLIAWLVCLLRTPSVSVCPSLRRAGRVDGWAASGRFCAVKKTEAQYSSLNHPHAVVRIERWVPSSWA